MFRKKKLDCIGGAAKKDIQCKRMKDSLSMHSVTGGVGKQKFELNLD